MTPTITPERIDEIERLFENAAICADEVQELIDAARELMNWRKAARVAAEEPCEGERHCACVPPLRARVKELEAENAALLDAPQVKRCLHLEAENARLNADIEREAANNAFDNPLSDDAAQDAKEKA